MNYIRNTGIVLAGTRSALRLTLIAALAISMTNAAYAGSATWKLNPNSSIWSDDGNWTPATIPGAGDTATFAVSNVTTISNPFTITVGNIVFSENASAYTISPNNGISLIFSGLITNDSGHTQNFTLNSFQAFFFSGSASAGSNTLFTSHTTTGVTFLDNSSAGSATFTCESVAGVTFRQTTTADKATIILDGGTVRFFESSGADAATLIANGSSLSGSALIDFEEHSRGGSARVEVFGSGALAISAQKSGSVTIGSLEGDGDVFLGGNQLVVGRNHLSTTFSGTIQNGRSNAGVGGSLVKIGGGKLVLANTNTYTGGTRVLHGQLFVNNTGRSGTGSGPVSVEGGKLGGNGSIGAGVKIGTGSGPGATLAPGGSAASTGTLEIKRALTFNSDGIYQAQVNSSNATADQVIANGVTINAGAQFGFADLGSGTLPVGTVLTVINNTAATPIAGTFTNLPDGSTFTVNGNTFKANYSGGDGNNLTLKVQ
jgi:autotransporter-associated beta strand protein